MRETPVPSTLDIWLRRLAWSACAFSLALFVAQVWIWSLPPATIPSLAKQQTAAWAFGFISITMAALIVRRRPRHPIGWWLGILGLGVTYPAFLAEYADYALLRNPGGLPAGDVALWLAPWSGMAISTARLMLILLFPTGHLVSPRWTPLIWVTVGANLFDLIERQFTPGPIYLLGIEAPTNPFAIAWLPPLFGRGSAGLILGQACTLAALGALVYRFRRARGAERQQLKWFAFGAAWLWVVPLRPLFVSFGYIGAAEWLDRLSLGTLVLMLQPITIAIGILHYGLFDIDVVINRTLVYGTVTALFAGGFAALSVLAQRLTLAVTGQESQVAVVLAALVVTALFQPVRWRVQTFVDRRFYRTKYDASRTLERFASRVRDEVELGRLQTALVAVVKETMQPEHVSLWLRPRADQDERSRQALMTAGGEG